MPDLISEASGAWRPPLNQRNADRRRTKRQSERRALTRMVLRAIAERPGEWTTPRKVAESLGVAWGDALLGLMTLRDRGYSENYADLAFAGGARTVESRLALRYRVTTAGIAKSRREA
jgi:hypothetical protein